MKFNMFAKRVLIFCMLFMSLLIGVTHAQEKTQISVAVLNLPPNEDGQLHWRDGDKSTAPIQLSIRYFSDFLTIESGLLRIYAEPVEADIKDAASIKPLYTLKIPPGINKGFLVLLPRPAPQGDGFRWGGQLIPSNELKNGSIRIYNSSAQTLGLQLPGQNIKLLSGKFVNLDSKSFADSFPVKIYELGEKPKKVFSSVWRISPDRREISIIYMQNKSVKMKSLLFLDPNRNKPKPEP